MIKIEVGKGETELKVEGNAVTVVADMVIAICSIEKFLVKECGMNRTLAAALIIDAYKDASNMMDGKYEEFEETEDKTNE